MRAIVTCECCGHRQTVARPIRRPESFYLVCHDCERTLRVDVTSEDIHAAELTTRTATRAACRTRAPRPPWPPRVLRQERRRAGGGVADSPAGKGNLIRGGPLLESRVAGLPCDSAGAGPRGRIAQLVRALR